jgi:hypothetical protein
VVVAAIHDELPESPFALAHDEDIGGWSARIGACLVECGGYGVGSGGGFVGILAGGLSIGISSSSVIGCKIEEKFYREQRYFNLFG